MSDTRIVIVYKSGYRIELEVEHCELKWNDKELTQIKTTQNKKSRPKPLWFGLSNIEAVYEL